MYNPFVILAVFTNLFLMMFKMLFQFIKLIFQIIGSLYTIYSESKSNADTKNRNT